MALGTIKWFDQRKGFGFLTDQQGQDLYVHFTAVDPQSRPKLKPGQPVSFNSTPGEKGPKAVDVKLAEPPLDQNSPRPADQPPYPSTADR